MLDIIIQFLCRPSWVNILGTKYKIGALVHVGFNELLPLFGLVKTIYVLSSSDKRVYFQTEILHTEEFSEHYRSYIVRQVAPPEFQLIAQKQLTYFLPLHFLKPFGCADKWHVLPKYNIYNPN